MSAGAATVAFWAAAALVFYAYVGYPALLWVYARLRGRPSVRKDPSHRPPVSLVIVARDEEAHIGRKLDDCLAQDYPRDRLEILVVSDSSTDATDEIVGRYADRGVRLLRLSGPGGKPTGLNRALAEATGDIIVLCDARQRLDSGAVAALTASFADPTVGAVSGELFIAGAPGSATASGVGAYWRYEKLIRREEARLDSIVGATGALYAIRRALFRPLDPRTVLDDVALPMEVVRGGLRVVFEPDARAYDVAADTPAAEYRRKLRTLAGNFQLVALYPWLLRPWQNRLWWQFVSHKLLRLVVPWALLAMLSASLVRAATGSDFFLAIAAAQVLAYAAAAAGWLVERAGGHSRLLAVPCAFVMLNLAAGAAALTFMRRGGRPDWKPRARPT